MNKLDIVLNRLYKALEISKDVQFCKKYKIKQNTLSSWRNRNSIPYEKIEAIAIDENLSLDWILTGTGEIYKNQQQQKPIIDVEVNNGVINNGNITINTNKFNHKEDIREVIELLEYAPPAFIINIKNRLQSFKRDSQI